MPKYDLVIKNGDLVVPKLGVIKGDLGITGEKISAIALDIPEAEAGRTIDAAGKAVFPRRYRFTFSYRHLSSLEAMTPQANRLRPPPAG